MVPGDSGDNTDLTDLAEKMRARLAETRLRAAQEDATRKAHPVYAAAAAVPWHWSQCVDGMECYGRRFVRWDLLPEQVREENPHASGDHNLLFVDCEKHNTGQCPLPYLQRYTERDAHMAKCGVPPRYRYPRKSMIRAGSAFWAYCDNLAERIGAGRGLILSGGVGVGKTMALAYIAASAHHIVPTRLQATRFVFAPAMFDALHNAGQKGASEDDARLVAKCTQWPLLLLDDFGREYQSEWVFSRFEELVEERHANYRATCVSTNLTPAEMAGNDRWQRVVDRWRQSCEVVLVTGSSQRKPLGRQGGMAA